MEFIHEGREVYYDYEEEEDTSELLSHRPSLALPPPSSSSSIMEKEHMFDKVVTPSDVGKLNRLVIPKQHAERYFPLDASTNEKGLLLNFEDPTGKPWRFRYSYWNSSQSYVMTKGWSRFVKEKRLDAGDTVSFGRGVGEAGRHRLFIDWKRRPGGLHFPRLPLPGYHHHHRRELSSYVMPFPRSAVPLTSLVVPPLPTSGASGMGLYDRHRHVGYGYNPYMLYLRSEVSPSQIGVQLGIRGSGEESLAIPMVQGKGASKTVRLFGVDLDCSTSKDDSGGNSAELGHPPLASLQLKLGRSEMADSLDI
ncbi:unnamed protein product [Spirodela intermedia]|uniref:TF-B3 domain-containing protein n=1 Tax=Spirodela intermedia TaxID=51605 RepID=A0A7I8KPJ3_SPIIN|nr:unnamed protein product [Spirodela intermedia]